MANILVIEDDQNLRTILREILAQAGHTVTEAGDGSEAMDLPGAAAPDLVITDILMPEKEGIETIVALRRRHPGMKIMAMSGGGCVGTGHCLEMAREFGADSTISKPFNRKDILRAVEGLVGPAERVCVKRELPFAPPPSGLVATLPEQKISAHAAVLEMATEEPDPVQPVDVVESIPAAPEVLTLSADAAQLHGQRIRREEKDGQSNIGYWDRADEWVTWTVPFTRPGAFTVRAACATVHVDSELVVEVSGQQLTAKAHQTRDWTDFHVLHLGRIEIERPGEQVLLVRPGDPSTWKPINLRAVELTPAE
jgi:CheY-like chemotaxis protein